MDNSRKRFPILSTGDIIKIVNEHDLGRRFPILEAGEVIKISPGALSHIDVGQFVVIKRSSEEESDFSILLADEAGVMSSSSDEVGARVSRVEDVAVTLEVMSPLEDGGVG